ncbi:MAG: Tm-1-like ATP-binding domain-containing protein [Mycolicibacterium rufum]|nr:Tm-1-like ATP-binding domain-containing protein [Mycolicibacterium rufum]
MTSVTSDRRRGGAAPRVLVIGTFDTKAEELAALAGEIETLGGTSVLLDTSARIAERPPATLLGSRRFIDQDEVARAAGSTSAAISDLPRGEAVTALRAGVSRLLHRLHDAGEIDGVVCMGGAGTHIAGPALQELPLGFPKLIVSPLASGSRTFATYVGIRDVAVMHSVADIIGINSVTGPVYRSAAGYIYGAALAHATPSLSAEPTGDAAVTVAVSMNGNTTPALMRARDRLESLDIQFVAFHANGTGGRALEDAVRSGKVDGVLDYTTTELGAHLVGGLMDPGPDRMESAGRAGLPQVLVPGCIDFITCGPLAAAEAEFPGRTYFGHNPELTLVRLTADEMAGLGAVFARKANAATGPTEIIVPMGGFSVPDSPGGAFWDPEADGAFVAALRDNIASHVPLTVLDGHINDEAFIDHVVGVLTATLRKHQQVHPPAFA